MPFKKKVVKKVILDDPGAPLYVKDKDKELIIETKILNIEPGLTDNEKAMLHFGLIAKDILVTKDYLDKLVIITNNGKKLTWPKG